MNEHQLIFYSRHWQPKLAVAIWCSPLLIVNVPSLIWATYEQTHWWDMAEVVVVQYQASPFRKTSSAHLYPLSTVGVLNCQVSPAWPCRKEQHERWDHTKMSGRASQSPSEYNRTRDPKQDLQIHSAEPVCHRIVRANKMVWFKAMFWVICFIGTDNWQY